MKILAIDSSAGMAGVAFCLDEQLLSNLQDLSGHTHSETLLPMIENTLKAQKATVEDIDLFAVSVGPGSYTGIRIGVATVKGLASGRGTPCVPVSALHALAWNCVGFEGLICPVMDARRGQMYTALFECIGGKITRLTEDRLLPIEEIDRLLQKENRKIYLVGDGFEKTKEKLSVTTEETPVLLRYQNGYSVAMCALDRYRAEPEADYREEKLLPVYLRATQAERERLEREKGTAQNSPEH